MLPSAQTSTRASRPFVWKPSKTLWGTVKNTAQLINSRIYEINNSKLFAGIVIILLNISSKFVTIKLSKGMESYFKNTFNRDILIFAMAWMGTRDIYVAIFMTLLFVLAADYLLNEESRLCCLPEGFTEYHLSINETGLNKSDKVSEQDIERAKDILARAEAEKTQADKD